MTSHQKNAELNNIVDNLLLFFPLFYRKMLRIDKAKSRANPINMQLRVLFMLVTAGTVQPSEIASTMGISKPNVTSLVDKLIGAGYAVRHHDDKDRRVINILATEKGRHFVARKKRALSDRMKKNLSWLNTDEIKALDTLLETFKNIIRRIDDTKTVGSY